MSSIYLLLKRNVQIHILVICDRSIFYSKRKYYIFILIKYFVIICSFKLVRYIYYRYLIKRV